MNEEEKIEREYTKEETDRRCPSCGGTLSYSPETGGLACPFCSYKEEIEEEEGAGEIEFDSVEFGGNCDWGAEKKSVVCESCGAELILDELEISSRCPYCDSNLVVEEKAADTLAPGGVCPFKVTKEQAGNRFKSWLGGKIFCPSAAKKAARAKDFVGVYLPYWTFDAGTHSHYSARFSRTHTRHRNGKTETYVTHHNTSGTYSSRFDDLQIAASERYDESLLEKLEPFDTENNVGYKPEYLAGFAAERYSVGINDAWGRAREEIDRILRRDITHEIRENERASNVNYLSFTTSFYSVTYKYLLVPVWISSYKYRGKIFSFMVNGRTGRVGGRYPLSPWRILAAVLIALVVIFCALLLLGEQYPELAIF